MMTELTKDYYQPAIQGSIACVTCGCGSHDTLDLQRRIAVGFGSAGYSKDGKTVLQESANDEFEDCPLVITVENEALADPEHDWRIFFDAPLYSAVYQRHGRGHWVLIEKGMGFA